MKEEKLTLKTLQEILENTTFLIDKITSEVESVKSVKFRGSFLTGLANLITAAIRTIELIEEIEASEKLADITEAEQETIQNLTMKKSELYELLKQLKTGDTNAEKAN